MKKISAISFTPKYDELEDRIRISINYDNLTNRVDFMLTRSFILKLFPVLDEYMLKFYDADSTIISKTSDEIKEKVKDSKETSITNGIDLELYKQEDELLLEVKFSYVKETKLTIITFVSKNTEATAQLDVNSMKQIFIIIKSTIPFFSWGISQNI